MSGEERAAEVVAAARALVGVPFRLQGRDRDGLDCVGVAALALGRAAPRGYGLRSGDTAKALVRPGPLQLHLMVGTGAGFVHAHAGLRRVVEMPGESPWPIIGWWRA